MFYCDDCAKKCEWPESFGRSTGPCEICGQVRVCNDLPSSQLPDRKPSRLPEGASSKKK